MTDTPESDLLDDNELDNKPSSGQEIEPGEGSEDSEVNPTQENNEDEIDGKRDRSADARIRELIAKNKELESKLSSQQTREQNAPIPSTVRSPELTPDQIKAINALEGMGFVRQEKLKGELESLQTRLVLDTEHGHLEDQFDGSDGRPAYDRKEVESYMRTNGIYKPEVAYKALHEQELLDWHLKQSSSQKKQRPYTASPAAPGKGEDNTISRDKLAEMQAKGGLEWRNYYEKNRSKILSLMAEGKL